MVKIPLTYYSYFSGCTYDLNHDLYGFDILECIDMPKISARLSGPTRTPNDSFRPLSGPQ